MGTYLYADYSPFEHNLNFVNLLKSYVNTSTELLELEEKIKELDRSIKEKRKTYETITKELDSFISKIDNAATLSLGTSTIKDYIKKYVKQTLKLATNVVEEGKQNLSKSINKQVLELERQYYEIKSTTIRILNNFILQNPIAIKNEKAAIKLLSSGIYEVLLNTECEADISYQFIVSTSESSFWKEKRRVSDFGIMDVKIPIKLKKPWLAKEYEPEFLKIDEFYLKNVTYDGNIIEMSFSREIEEDTEKIIFTCSKELPPRCFYISEGLEEHDIFSEKALADHFNSDFLTILDRAIRDRVKELFSAAKTVRTIKSGSHNVIEENIFFVFLQIVAKYFSSTVKKVQEKSPRDGELIIRFEEDQGKRTEYFYKIDEAITKLNINKKGKEILSSLGF
jgi:hypothetical protein